MEIRANIMIGFFFFGIFLLLLSLPSITTDFVFYASIVVLCFSCWYFGSAVKQLLDAMKENANMIAKAIENKQ